MQSIFEKRYKIKTQRIGDIMPEICFKLEPTGSPPDHPVEKLSFCHSPRSAALGPVVTPGVDTNVNCAA